MKLDEKDYDSIIKHMESTIKEATITIKLAKIQLKWAIRNKSNLTTGKDKS